MDYSLPHSAKPQCFPMIPSILDLLLQLRLHFHQQPLPGSLCELQPTTQWQVSAVPHESHALRTCTIWVTLPLLSSTADPGTPLAHSGPQLLCDESKETLYRRFCLSDACLLITALLQPQMTGTDGPSEAKVSL